MLSDKNFINIAKELSSASKCVSKRVGAVIVKMVAYLALVIMAHLLVLQTVVIIGMVNILLRIMNGVKLMRFMQK